MALSSSSPDRVTSQPSFGHARAELSARLRARRTEIAQAALTRVYTVSDSPEVGGPEYVEGLREAVSAALDYGLDAIALGEERAQILPTALLSQARLAARNGIPLPTVLRRYCAGYAVLGDFLIEEAGEGGLLSRAALQRLLRTQSTVLDRLLAAVTEEYSHEAESRPDSAAERLAERVKRLLDGELLDTSDFPYEFDGHHLAAVAAGSAATKAIPELGKVLDCHLLLVRRSEEITWAWFGARRPLDPARLQRLASEDMPAGVSLAIGESAHGLAGWRLTHKQARAALRIALRSPESFIRYSDVALLASILQDDLLVTSLRELYLSPLAEERDGGEILRETLRAYFAADYNVSSAAAALGVNRRTVASRLRTIEERLGRSIGTCTTEMDVALELEDIDRSILPHSAFSRI